MIQYKIKIVKALLLNKLFLIIDETLLIELMDFEKSVINKKLSLRTIDYLLDRGFRVYSISTISMGMVNIRASESELVRIDNNCGFFSVFNNKSKSISGIVIQEYELHSKKVLP